MLYSDSPTPIYSIGKISGSQGEIEKNNRPKPQFVPSIWEDLFREKGRSERKMDARFGLPDPDLLYRENFMRPR